MPDSHGRGFESRFAQQTPILPSGGPSMPLSWIPSDHLSRDRRQDGASGGSHFVRGSTLERILLCENSKQRELKSSGQQTGSSRINRTSPTAPEKFGITLLPHFGLKRY